MSYDLAVWEGAQPPNDGGGGAVYDQLYEEYMEGEAIAPAPGILAYAEALAERWAVLSEGETLGLRFAA